MDAIWVITWKMIEGNVGVKCLLIVRVVKDKFQHLDTYVGTASGSGQRLANAVAAENAEFVLFSLDVGQAFAKGMTFEEFSELSGQEVRKVELDVPKADLPCLRELPDFRDFNPDLEALTILKSIYGLKDALRAWRKKLHQAPIQWMSCRQLHSEPEHYCVHKEDGVVKQDVLKQAQQHVAEQQEFGVREVQPQAYVEGNLQCLLSVRVGELCAEGSGRAIVGAFKQFGGPMQGRLHIFSAYGGAART